MEVPVKNKNGSEIKQVVNIKILDNPAICNFLEDRKVGLKKIEKQTEQIKSLNICIDHYQRFNDQFPVQINIDTLKDLVEDIDNDRIQNQIKLDDEYDKAGIDILHELFSGLHAAGYTSLSEYHQVINITERWFHHYTEIKKCRMQKLEGLITWEEMNAEINAVLQRQIIINLDELETIR